MRTSSETQHLPSETNTSPLRDPAQTAFPSQQNSPQGAQDGGKDRTSVLVAQSGEKGLTLRFAQAQGLVPHSSQATGAHVQLPQ